MELERKIYNEFCNSENKSYNTSEISTNIFMLEAKLKSTLSKNQLAELNHYLSLRSKLQEEEDLQLIEFVLKNYAEDFLTNNIHY